MSFDTLKCDQCDLTHWQLPRLYSTTESGEVVIMMYPEGSEPFQRQMGYPASFAVQSNESGSIQSFFAGNTIKLQKFLVSMNIFATSAIGGMLWILVSWRGRPALNVKPAK